VVNKIPFANFPLINTVLARADNEDPANPPGVSVNTVFAIPATASGGDTTLFSESCEAFTLDVNVFEPERGLPLGINFELESGKQVRFDLLDISGYRVTRLYEGNFNAGPNRREWNGFTETGQQVGSGVYVVTLRSDDRELVCWKKVIIRR
jgi:hypothetical protein